MCGIVGVVAKQLVNQEIYDALTMLQHRGQDAAGIITNEGDRLYLHKDKGENPGGQAQGLADEAAQRTPQH